MTTRRGFLKALGFMVGVAAAPFRAKTTTDEDALRAALRDGVLDLQRACGKIKIVVPLRGKVR